MKSLNRPMLLAFSRTVVSTASSTLSAIRTATLKKRQQAKRKVRIVPITEVGDLLKDAPYYAMTEIPMAQYPDAVNSKDKSQDCRHACHTGDFRRYT